MSTNCDTNTTTSSGSDAADDSYGGYTASPDIPSDYSGGDGQTYDPSGVGDYSTWGADDNDFSELKS